MTTETTEGQKVTRNKRWRDGLKERVELEKKGNIYNMVKRKLALIGVCGMDLLVCCRCFLDFELQIFLSVNLPYIYIYLIVFFSHHDHFHNLLFFPHDQQILAKPSLVIFHKFPPVYMVVK